jgi:membrane protein
MINRFKRFFDAHPRLKAFIGKVSKDNIGMLASVVSWALLTSIVPIVVGLLGISGLILRSPDLHRSVVDHLHLALAGALSRGDIEGLVRVTIQHSGLFAVIGFLGVLWGGANVGGAISTVFQPIFQVGGRSFVKEKAIDVAMIFVLTLMMLIIVGATTASAMLDRLVAAHLPGIVSIGLGLAVSLLAAFLLFLVIYIVFPNVQPRYRMANVWRGTAISAVLFQILSLIFPVYAAFSHFTKYGAILGALLVLTAWIYFFSLILVVGAQVIAFATIRDAEREGEPVGTMPDGTVPQRTDVGEPRKATHSA